MRLSAQWDNATQKICDDLNKKNKTGTILTKKGKIVLKKIGYKQ